MIIFSTCYMKKRKESLRQIGLECRVEWGPLQLDGQGRPGRRTFEPRRRSEVWRIQSRELHTAGLARVSVQVRCCLRCLRKRALARVGDSDGSRGIPWGKARSLGTHCHSGGQEETWLLL